VLGGTQPHEAGSDTLGEFELSDRDKCQIKEAVNRRPKMAAGEVGSAHSDVDCIALMVHGAPAVSPRSMTPKSPIQIPVRVGVSSPTIDDHFLAAYGARNTINRRLLLENAKTPRRARMSDIEFDGQNAGFRDRAGVSDGPGHLGCSRLTNSLEYT
jgi:hypothetical protein